ncbi:hypothetical protein AJ80_09045 [Polytolypa hystricis UAMH7299]|uniref:Uncharacterized protein n=1 Tax=Polytolypa hystricis (strain UAMH7299) TaxID=1447883 RepID=A0A2B7WX55_POLH7|nr:hypothetical protein AJ80_09045 [Polytolypa hystricis UAMH7299]
MPPANINAPFQQSTIHSEDQKDSLDGPKAEIHHRGIQMVALSRVGLHVAHFSSLLSCIVKPSPCATSCFSSPHFIWDINIAHGSKLHVLGTLKASPTHHARSDASHQTGLYVHRTGIYLQSLIVPPHAESDALENLVKVFTVPGTFACMDVRAVSTHIPGTTILARGGMRGCHVIDPYACVVLESTNHPSHRQGGYCLSLSRTLSKRAAMPLVLYV